jgi:hypothetical protein
MSRVRVKCAKPEHDVHACRSEDVKALGFGYVLIWRHDEVLAASPLMETHLTQNPDFTLPKVGNAASGGSRR